MFQSNMGRRLDTPQIWKTLYLRQCSCSRATYYSTQTMMVTHPYKVPSARKALRDQIL